MNKNVKVSKIEKAKAGKADVFVLHYEHLTGNNKGEVWTIRALAVKLPAEGRELLNTAKPGDIVSIGMEKSEGKDGKSYWNLSTVEPADSAPATTSYTKPAATKSPGRSTGYDNLGQQIGNSITNAVNSLGAGKTLGEYEERAVELVLMGDRVRAIIEQGGAVKKSEAALPTKEQEQDLACEALDNFDDEVGF